ncbi:phosphatase PAP2 family protein [Aromatoleum toluclasticum]|uniref:phosphatase PAP2 family protein n=1 Tax=Aromatoleum toluclasticum TaxID=92003 RepID=UPI001D19352C|nr:phosphatase PAP2 family protein [Aromatoleum toluclasticum]MCC4115635.1 phosphatase PAP2 family protein [Aromatoleum toluclasticum]
MEFIVLLIVTAIVSVAANVFAGPHAVPPIGTNQVSVQVGLMFFFVLAVILLALGESVRLAPRFSRERDGRLDLKELFRAVKWPPIESFLIVLVAAYGVSSSVNLVEVYRIESNVWYDQIFWGGEKEIFESLLMSPAALPKFWDAIYQVLWFILFIGLAGLARAQKTKAMAESLCAVIVAFHITRYVAIAFPSAGPVFYQPDLFDLSGTRSATFVPLLRDYMAGRVAQNGFLPGTQAFPSLHVGLAWCAVIVMAREWRWTLWLTLPWFSLNWMATLFLGWHYIVDGVGGVAVMSISLAVSYWLAKFGLWCSSMVVYAKRKSIRLGLTRSERGDNHIM